MKDLKLLKFPNQNINHERLLSVLIALDSPDEEYETIDGVLCALYNFVIGLEGSGFIAHDIIKLRGAIAEFYDND